MKRNRHIPELSGFAAHSLLPCAERKSAMKTRLLALPLVCLTVLTVYAASAHSQTIITFDDLALTPADPFILSGYESLSWSNFGEWNAILTSNSAPGYYYGMVSPSNVAFNGYGGSAEIDARGTNFDFLSAYLTGAWNSNLNIEVEGFRSGTLLYDTTVVASATSATLFTFDYTNIDRLYFNAYGGQVAFGVGPEYNFAMDNMTVEFVPEPSSLLLAAMGGISLVALVRRRRA
jgi:PEP-CTERM motif-containing protein